MARKTKKATRPMCEKIMAKNHYRTSGKDYNKKVFMSDAAFTPAEIQLLKSQNRWIALPFLHNEAQGILKKEIVMDKDIYPLTAEEYEQTEKVTSQEVLLAGNTADVEVEQFFLLPKD